MKKPLQDFTSLQKNGPEGFEGTKFSTSFAHEIRVFFQQEQAGGVYLSYYFLLLVIVVPFVFGVKRWKSLILLPGRLLQPRKPRLCQISLALTPP